MISKTRTAALAFTGLVALGGAAACGSSSSGGNTTNSATSPSSSTASSPSTAATPAATLPSLSNGVHTQVILDAGFLSALKSLKVTPGLIGNATLSKKGVLTFPITGGHATYYTPGTHDPYVVAVIKHQGSGITLTAGGIKVGLSNFVVNAGTSMLTGKVTVTAKGKTTVAAKSGFPLFFLNGSTLQPLKMTNGGNDAVLYGTKVFLTTTAAQTLSKVYSLKAGTLSNQTLVGVAKITLGLK